jgi:hypothetical protein
MYSFIVLGLVPGTNLQITFQAWLLVLAAVLALIVVIRVSYRLIVQLSMETIDVHQPLHANQLHSRLS